MKQNIKISLIVLFILCLIFVLLFIAGKSIIPELLGNSSTDNNAPISTADEKLLDKKAPAFDLSNITGNRVRLDDFLNTPVVLVFWATWNQDSADQIKIFDDYLLSKNVQVPLIKVVAINSLEDISAVKSFIKRGSYSVPVALDITGGVTNDYNIKSLPTTYFIDRDGITREIYTGVLSEDMIVDKVENLLK
jgi:peroxiredoxin